MPPSLPDRTFDARFASGKFIERLSSQAIAHIPILVKNAVYPLTVSWSVKRDNTSSYWLTLPGNGKKMSLTGSLNVAVDSRTNGVVMIDAQATSAPSPCPPAQRTDGEDQYQEASSIPHSYSLAQNHPNPFNPTTSIQYELPASGFVSLKIFDVLGREVATLANEVQDAGYKSASFNAEDLSSGVYFYRLQSGTFVGIRKMILMR